jgi:hypothetical protein
MNDTNFDMNTEGISGWQRGVKIAAFLVYMIGALFATIMFSNSLADRFPDDQWLRIAAYAGSWANFASVLVMLVAKDYWVSGGAMKIAAWIFWVAEVAMLILNTLAAYDSAWAGWWTPLSPAAPVAVVIVWGVLWYLSPDHKKRESVTDFFASSQLDFQGKLRRAMKSSEVQDIMSQAAQEAARQYAEKAMGVILDETHIPTKGKKTKVKIETGKSSDIAQPEPVEMVNTNGNGARERVDPTSPRRES